MVHALFIQDKAVTNKLLSYPITVGKLANIAEGVIQKERLFVRLPRANLIKGVLEEPTMPPTFDPDFRRASGDDKYG